MLKSKKIKVYVLEEINIFFYKDDMIICMEFLRNLKLNFIKWMLIY